MRSHLGTRDKEILNELSAMLMVMLGQYFSCYSSTKTIQHEANLEQLLAYTDNKLEDWENSQVAMEVTVALIQTTQQFLPGFQSYRREDCQAILDMKMRGESVVQLEIEPSAMERFSKWPSPQPSPISI